ncbi:DNA starvation/stationary phase protection protein [Peribacillus saganii]|uniref:DNA starvation/stationary phase protection protein n=1 Tax=Peribacillus saganii TaxID=2303992 RepID=A0A372LDC7_9BACI|nr:DNA starvation/stationary phase protection protein [Peribacillus saganii]RFU63656.1 DNA starvation/stationary phase protection protein [Peribacillus saganii]
MSKQLVDLVNQEIANFSVLYTKLHNYHWFVNGPRFFELHVKFEELYNETTAHLDEVAERLLAIGEKPVATVKEFLTLTTIEEATGSETPDDMVSSLSSDFQKIAKELEEGIRLAEEAGDEGTGDMLLGIKKSYEKHAWMLNSYLGR